VHLPGGESSNVNICVSVIDFVYLAVLCFVRVLCEWCVCWLCSEAHCF